MYQFLRASGFVGIETYKADTAVDSIIWEVFAKQSAGIYESSQLIRYYLYHIVHALGNLEIYALVTSIAATQFCQLLPKSTIGQGTGL